MPEHQQGGFALSIGEWCDRVEQDEDQVLRAVTIGLLNNLVFRSPVGQPDLWQSPPPPGYVGGRFRANWQVSVDAPAEGTLPTIDASGQLALLAGQVTINGIACGPPVYIVNNLPYALPLEYGHSQQAPGGMVRLAVVEFQQIVDDAVRDLR